MVSDFTSLARSNQPDNQSIYVLDRFTGKRIPDVQIKLTTLNGMAKNINRSYCTKPKQTKMDFAIFQRKALIFKQIYF